MGKKFAMKLSAQQKDVREDKKPQEEVPDEAGPFGAGDSEDDVDEEDSILSSPESSDMEGDDEPGSGDADEGGEDEDEDEDDLGIVDDEFDGEDDEGIPGLGGEDEDHDDGEDADDDDGEQEGERKRPRDESDDEQPGSEDMDNEQQGSQRQPAVKKQKLRFSEGEKGKSFAKAFEKILQRPVRGLDGSRGVKPKEGAADDSKEGQPLVGLVKGAVGDVAILADSKTHRDRQAEVAGETAAQREAKRARQEAKKRGKLLVPKKGQDPAHDLREKGLQKLATRGVVLLFNAVTKAQRAQQEAAAAGAKAPVNAAKSTLLATLQGGQESAAPLMGLPSLGGVAGGKGGGVLGLLGNDKKKGGKGKDQQAGAAVSQDEPAWKVLQDSFTGLAGSGKMKDWDKQLSDEEGEQAGASGDDDGDDDGW